MSTATAAFAGLGAIVITLTAVWAISVRLRDASIVDICWGPGFVLLAWLYCLSSGEFRPRPLLVATLITVWGLRLGVHIFRRHHDEDPRYRAMREAHGHAFWWRSLFTVFWLQAVILWFVALPVLVAARAREPMSLTAVDIMGLLVFTVGFAFEAIGDTQLARFQANPANRGKVLATGLWRYTRHPNYFGDALLWWGIYVLAAAAPGGLWTIASPVLMTMLLLRVSGVRLLEQGLKASKPGYTEYIERTSAFIPWFPRPKAVRRPEL